MNTILILNNWNNVILHIYNKSINSWTIKIYENFLPYNSIIWILFRTTLFRNCYIFNYKFRLFAKIENFPQTLLYWSPILKLGEAYIEICACFNMKDLRELVRVCRLCLRSIMGDWGYVYCTRVPDISIVDTVHQEINFHLPP